MSSERGLRGQHCNSRLPQQEGWAAQAGVGVMGVGVLLRQRCNGGGYRAALFPQRQERNAACPSVHRRAVQAAGEGGSGD